MLVALARADRRRVLRVALHAPGARAGERSLVEA